MARSFTLEKVTPLEQLGEEPTRQDVLYAYGITSTGIADRIVEVAPAEEFEVYRATVEGEPDAAEVLHVRGTDTTGITSGVRTIWFRSTGDVERDVDLWLNDPEELAWRKEQTMQMGRETG